jgi:hypothetical protein
MEIYLQTFFNAFKLPHSVESGFRIDEETGTDSWRKSTENKGRM